MDGRQYDAIVIGAGPAGLAAALALGNAGARTAIVDAGHDAGSDRRTSALMAGSVAILRGLGAWDACEAHAAPLRRLRLIDDGGWLLRAPTLTFEATEIGEPAFGWNIPNRILVPALRDRAAGSEGIDRIDGSLDTLCCTSRAAVALLADGTRIEARVVVAADGRESCSRRAAGIGVVRRSRDQAALVADLDHERPHGDTSTEFHRRGGPFTLVPLPGNRSSLVWVTSREESSRLKSFTQGDLAGEIARVSHRLLGDVELQEPVQVHPLTSLKARRLAANRVLLVGECGHVIPPIGAQGLNLGLRDAAEAARVVGESLRAAEDPGSDATMWRYQRARQWDVETRMAAVDATNLSLLRSFLPLEVARAIGIGALARFAPLRRTVMREGIA